MGDKYANARSSSVSSKLKKDGCLKPNELVSSSNHSIVQSNPISIDHRLEKSSSRSPSRPARKVYYRIRDRSMKEKCVTRGEKHSHRSRRRSRSSRREDRYSYRRSMKEKCVTRGEKHSHRSRRRSRSSRREDRYSYRRSRSHSRGLYGRSRSRSPLSSLRRHIGTREQPEETSILGVFGLSKFTSEQQLYGLFSKFGPIEELHLVIDRQTGKSRGFGFVDFKNSTDAKVAKASCSGLEIDGRSILVDFSITRQKPTSALYMEKPAVHCYSEYYRKRGSHRDRRSPSPGYQSRR